MDVAQCAHGSDKDGCFGFCFLSLESDQGTQEPVYWHKLIHYGNFLHGNMMFGSVYGWLVGMTWACIGSGHGTKDIIRIFHC